MYSPRNVPSEADDLPRFFHEELPTIAKEMNGPRPFIMLDVLHEEPAKRRAGMLVEASGAPDWDPGSGAGCYIYRSGSWVKLG